MKTNFTDQQLTDPNIKRADEILRTCLHCGFCTATCPTYQILGDELDSPRGRIYLIKDMFESGRPADKKTVEHVDKCLSCLACMTTCPSGVHYMHLIDQARAYIEKTYKRPFMDRVLRWTLSQIIPYPKRFRLALWGGKLGKPLAFLIPDQRLKAMLEIAPKRIPPVSKNDAPQVFAAIGPRKKRVALLTGCAQKALNTNINDATISVLRRLGCEVVIAKGMGCCGALTHHMGKQKPAHASAAANIRIWMAEVNGEGLDAVVINTSGCGTTVKDYGHMFRNDSMSTDAAHIASITKDISEILIDLEFPKSKPMGIKVAYHAACSLQHGQQIKTQPKTLLKRAGFEVVEPKDSHLCCGSAGTYNLLQPEHSQELKSRKVTTLEAKQPDVIAAGNIGCMIQIGSGTDIPIVHTVELLNWAISGQKPREIV